MSNEIRKYDVVIWGATGFTGRLVAEYLFKKYGTAGELRWAMAGRNLNKLETIRKQFGDGAQDIDLLVAQIDDSASIDNLVKQTKVICSTVGPFLLHGSQLLASCAKLGTDYCDNTGEAHWVQSMLDAHEKEALASGARIVNFCGYDSIPSDLGTFVLQNAMIERHGVPAKKVKSRVTSFIGGLSGGTYDSIIVAVKAAISDPIIKKAFFHPYSLNPKDERSGPDGGDRFGISWDRDISAWVGPFIMAVVNTRVVRRSNALLNYRYGKDFSYDEFMSFGSGINGFLKAIKGSVSLISFFAGIAIQPVRYFIQKGLPKVGEGPSLAEREAGSFSYLIHGKHPQDSKLDMQVTVTGDRDPGYGSTSKMLSQCAVCLAKDSLDVKGGFWTPSTAMGNRLVARLAKDAGVEIKIV